MFTQGKFGKKTYTTLKIFHLIAYSEDNGLHFKQDFEMLSLKVLVVLMHFLEIAARIYKIFETVQNPNLSIIWHLLKQMFNDPF